ncbi:MAG TPA: DUF929 family protein, partial [Streptosporangiaceae bacterium]|nr:DUF929 family protein [Streptosporangiaceae bacterium]
LIVIKSLGGSSAKASDAGTASATAAATVTRDIATVPATTLDKVAAGPAYPAKGSIYPHAIRTISPAGTTLTSNGKPEVVYVGAEYCPFCAAERWALSVALSRFGTFSGLHLIHSSSTDTDPNTPTVSFYKATYTSKYVAFTTTEAQKVDKSPLQPVTALDKTLMTKYDTPPYVPSTQYDDSFPFVDFGNRYVIDGASYDPMLLANLTWQQIGADLANPKSTVGQAIDATANRITAAICTITNHQPGSVCTSTGVTSASGSI